MDRSLELDAVHGAVSRSCSAEASTVSLFSLVSCLCLPPAGSPSAGGRGIFPLDITVCPAAWPMVGARSRGFGFLNHTCASICTLFPDLRKFSQYFGIEK